MKTRKKQTKLPPIGVKVGNYAEQAHTDNTTEETPSAEAESTPNLERTIKYGSAHQVQQTLLNLQSQRGNHAVQRLIQRNRATSTAGVIQRVALDWKTWAEGAGALGTENTFADSGSVVVINDAFEASDAFLDNLLATKEDDLKKIIQVAKLVKTNNFDVTKLAKDDGDFLKKVQSSGGLRVRFRTAIGPTGHITNLSVVDKYIKEVVAPACGGADNIPDYLKTARLTPPDRVRLYDLPNNPSRKQAESVEAIQWALAQRPAPTGVRPFVNYVEYYFSSKEELNFRLQGQENTIKDEKDRTLVIADTDSRLEAVAKDLAKTAHKAKLNKIFGRFFGKKATAISASDASTINTQLGTATLVITETIDTSTTGDKLKELADSEAVTYANANFATFNPQAKTALKEKDVTAAVQTEKARLEAAAIALFGRDYLLEQAAVATAGYSGAGPVIPDFLAHKADNAYLSAQIKVLAASNKIPFTSDDSAAYHGLKHYKEIAGTDDGIDRGESQINKLTAYLNSCNKTIETGVATIGQPAQFGELPSFFFRREIKFKSDASKVLGMRAIVIVLGTGNVKVATYFNN